MRVLHCNTEKTWRGGERQIDLLVRFSDPSTKHVVACRSDGALSQRLRKQQHHVQDLNLRNGLDLFAAWRLKKICERESVDIVHCHTPKTHSVALLSKWLGNNRPILCTKRTSFPIGNNSFSKLKYLKVQQVVCVSEASAQALKSQIPQLTPLVIPSAVERLENVKPAPLESIHPETIGKRKIGYVAALTSEKNPNTFIETARLVVDADPDVCFLWIGDGPLAMQLQKEVDRHALQKHVIFTGFQSDIQSWLGALDLLFFPSKLEGYPTTLLDAMQLSVPVIASDIPGIREIIQDKITGFLCDPEDPNHFAKMIKTVLDEGSTLDLLVRNAKDTIKGSYAEDMGRAYYKIYQDMMA